jgi:putative nucleotidyltransferase with HDIG domain
VTNDETPRRPRRRGKKKQARSRKLNLVSRVRGGFRRGADRVLSADAIWSPLFVLVVLLTVGSQRCGTPYDQFALGEVAPHDIKAARAIDIEDEALTTERRQQARDRVPEYYVHDRERGARLARDLAEVFEQGRQGLEAGRAADESAAGVAEAGLSDEVRRILVDARYDESLERELAAALESVMRGLVVSNKSLLERTREITLVHIPGHLEEALRDYDAVIDVEQARERLSSGLMGRLELPPARKRALAAFTATFLDANVYLDSELTHARREAAAMAVPPVVVRVPRGGVLIEKGQRFTPEIIARLDAGRGAAAGGPGLLNFLALLFLTCILAFFLYRYSGYHQRAFTKLAHLHAFLVLMLVSTLLLAKGMLWLAGQVVDTMVSPFDQLHYYTYLIPLGAGAILVALLANGRIAMVYAGFAALLFGAMTGQEFSVFVWAMIVQLSGIYAISTYRERAALLRAGLVVGGIGAVTALALETLKGDLEPLSGSLYGAGLAMVGGAVGVGLVISFSLPLLEGLFNVLTDIRLLELSNVNNPLLAQLAVKAPGSYNHSLVVGTLAEEAAKAIGANSLFCRVAAFYHDIGKVNHAEYYVENQRGINPHDRLTPSMSALIIASHVKDGIKMAREAGLPEQIVDIIPQHHGTKLMTYFYEKARQNADPGLGPVKEEDFRYPGPKPQTREAAIFMLADAVEAAARTIDEPTPNRLREMIRKVTSAVVLDGQFDSCDLTFADLDRIKEAFLRYLVSMHHQRVDYPGFEFGGRARAETRSVGEAQERRVARGL